MIKFRIVLCLVLVMVFALNTFTEVPENSCCYFGENCCCPGEDVTNCIPTGHFCICDLETGKLEYHRCYYVWIEYYGIDNSIQDANDNTIIVLDASGEPMFG